MRDELLGYAADVRLSAVSCLQNHLEIHFFFSHSLSLSPSPSAEKSCKIKKLNKSTLLLDRGQRDSSLTLTSVGVCPPVCVYVCVGMFVSSVFSKFQY